MGAVAGAGDVVVGTGVAGAVSPVVAVAGAVSPAAGGVVAVSCEVPPGVAWLSAGTGVTELEPLFDVVPELD